MNTPEEYQQEIARLTAENARLMAELNDEQVAHNRIAELCHKAGVSTPDGTSVGAVKRLTARLAEVEKALQEAIDFIDDGDSPAVGGVVMDSLVPIAYVSLAGILERGRTALEAPRE